MRVFPGAEIQFHSKFVCIYIYIYVCVYVMNFRLENVIFLKIVTILLPVQ